MATQLKDAESEQVDPPANENADTSQSGGSDAEARLLGWKPEAEYTGSAPWIDAEAFMGKRNEHLGLANKRIEQLNVQVRKLETQIKRVMKAEQGAYASALADIKKEMQTAVETGDVAAFKALDQRADGLRQDMAADTPQSGEDPTIIFENFRNENVWYDKANLASAREDEVEARLYADKRLRQMSREANAENLSPAAVYERVESDFATLAKEIAEQFPTLKMKAMREKPASDVAGVTRGGQRSGAKTYANMPPEFQRAADRFHEQGVYKGTLAEAREKYAKSYFAKES